MRRWLVISLTCLLILCSVGMALSAEADSSEQPPVVVSTIPKAGDSMVDPSQKEIRITFSKPMGVNGWSLVMQDKKSFPKIAGKVGFKKDMLTFVAPMKLEPGKKYIVWINSERYQNFRDQEGRPAVPYLLSFHTKP
jgi:hypothetical protein